MNQLIISGLYLLAVGALLGWPIALLLTKPTSLHRIGITRPKRILQMHIDYIMMGTILIAVGAAVPELPSWIAIPLTIGAITNPLLFLPLAFKQAWMNTKWYQAVSVLSFLAVTYGTVGAAVWATCKY